MRLAARSDLTEKFKGEALLGFYAPWPLCTKCEDGGDVDVEGKTYTHTAAAINYFGVGAVVPSFTAHECRTCKTWHIQLTGLMGDVNLSMRVHATHEELEEAGKTLGKVNQYKTDAEELARKVGLAKYRPKQKEIKDA